LDKDFPGNHIKILTDEPSLDFAKAKDWAELKAKEISVPLGYDSPTYLEEKRKKSDPLISELERALDLGEFIPYNRSWDFV
jgi:hypothetical protein